MAVLQACVISLVALIITPGFLFYFDITPKLLVLLVGAATALAGLRARRNPRWLTALFAANLVSLAISTALSSHVALSAFGTNWRRYGLVTQAAILVFAWTVSRNSESARMILRGVMAAGAVTAIYGIVQYFGWDPFLPGAAYHIGEGIWTIVRPPGTLGYVSYFATWLLFVAFLSMELAALEGAPLWRKLAMAVAGLAVIAMLLTGTRAAVLALAAGGGFWLYKTRFHFTRRIAGIAAICLIAATAFYFSPAGWKLRSRARWFVEDPFGGARPALWRDTLRMAGERLPFGYGPEVFTATFPRFQSKALSNAYPDFASESPHNIFLDALISQGVPGLAILVTLCVLAVRKARPWVGAALVAGIVSQFFTAFTIPTALIFYVTIALSMGRAAPRDDEEPQTFWPHLAAAAPVALAFLYLAVRYTAADHALALTRQYLDAGVFSAASRQYSAYERWRLPGTSADLWYSRALMAWGQRSRNPAIRLQLIPDAAAAALRATQTAEDPFNAWYNVAVVYAVENDGGKAEASLRKAIAASPNWFKPHWTLAQLLRLEGRMPEAAQEASCAAELDAGKNAEVMSTLQQIREERALLHR